MKLSILLLALTLTACASTSEYNQGCQDGVGGLSKSSDKAVKKYCDGLESKRKLEKEEAKGGRSRDI